MIALFISLINQEEFGIFSMGGVSIMMFGGDGGN